MTMGHAMNKDLGQVGMILLDPCVMFAMPYQSTRSKGFTNNRILRISKSETWPSSQMTMGHAMNKDLGQVGMILHDPCVMFAMPYQSTRSKGFTLGENMNVLKALLYFLST